LLYPLPDDEETGLYYFRARYYDPRTSVWQSTDPVLFGGVIARRDPRLLAVYSCSWNNPVLLHDPDGRDPSLPVRAGVCAAFGAFAGSAGYYLAAEHPSWRGAGAAALGGAVAGLWRVRRWERV